MRDGLVSNEFSTGTVNGLKEEAVQANKRLKDVYKVSTTVTNDAIPVTFPAIVLRDDLASVGQHFDGYRRRGGGHREAEHEMAVGVLIRTLFRGEFVVDRGWWCIQRHGRGATHDALSRFSHGPRGDDNQDVKHGALRFPAGKMQLKTVRKRVYDTEAG